MASSAMSHPSNQIRVNATQGLEPHGLLNNSTGGRHFIPLFDLGYTFIGCLLSLTWSLGSFFNGVCLYVFARNRRLRSPTNIFIMSLNLCDFLMCFVGTPPAMLSAWSHRWIWGDILCDIEGFNVYFLGMASMYILMAISVDRYIAISKPLLGTRITKNVALVSCGLCYFLGFLWAVFPMFGWNTYDLEGAGISCSVVWESDDPLYTSYIYAIFVFCLVVPLAVMFYSYWGVLSTLRNLNKNSVWDMNSRVAKKNLAIEKKMLKTAVMIVVSFLVCWMPYTIVSFIAAFFGSHLIPPIFATIPPVIAKCQGLIDPVIYVISNKQMRTAVCEIVPCEGLKKSLLKEEEQVEEQESEESDVEGDGSKQKGKKSGNKQKKADSSKQKKSGAKKNQIQPVEKAANESMVTEEGETSVSHVAVVGTGEDPQVSFSKSGGKSSP